MKIVLDSDVVIAGLISLKGAGNFLLENFLGEKSVRVLSSTEQIKEIKAVLKKDKFVWKKQEPLWKKFQKNTSKIKISSLRPFYSYVLDKNDAHILAAAVLGQASFLITYNLKDYLLEKIKDKFDILVVRPGYFIQFCRQRDLLR